MVSEPSSSELPLVPWWHCMLVTLRWWIGVPKWTCILWWTADRNVEYTWECFSGKKHRMNATKSQARLHSPADACPGGWYTNIDWCWTDTPYEHCTERPWCVPGPTWWHSPHIDRLVYQMCATHCFLAWVRYFLTGCYETPCSVGPLPGLEQSTGLAYCSVVWEGLGKTDMATREAAKGGTLCCLGDKWDL